MVDELMEYWVIGLTTTPRSVPRFRRRLGQGSGALPRLQGRLRGCGTRYVGYGGQVRGRVEQRNVVIRTSLFSALYVATRAF